MLLPFFVRHHYPRSQRVSFVTKKVRTKTLLTSPLHGEQFIALCLPLQTKLLQNFKVIHTSE